MNSPYRVHSALHSAAPNTIPFSRVNVQAEQQPPKQEVPNKLALLVKIEGEIRQQKTWAALIFHALNEARPLLGFDQAFFFRANKRDCFVLEAASSVAEVDVHAPLSTALANVINHIERPSKPLAFNLSKQLSSHAYPFANSYWLPMLDAKGNAFGGLLLQREAAWEEPEKKICLRVAEAYAHGLRVLRPPSLLSILSLPRWAIYGLPIVLALLAIIPVPLTALAPFEVVALNPVIIAAPIDGAIKEILAEPNATVQQGDLLLQYEVTQQAADAAISEQKVVVAEARLATMQNGAFSDSEMKSSLAVTEKELELARAEHDYALNLLTRASVTAPTSGLLIYSSKSDWIGRPVRVGEKIMEIADPMRISYRIDLDVHDSIALAKGNAVRLFFDSDPLHPRSAKISESSFHAVEKPGGMLAYTLKALPADNATPARIGLRGTAQISGEQVSLGFYLLRRPIAAVRQYIGY